MKVLLTGGNGFVGSHILDALCARDIPAVLLARPTSDLQFVRNHLPRVRLRRGSVADPASLREALSGITHVIHCAGTTKASRLSEFDAVNRGGTAHLVDALDTQAGQIRRLVLISSLAACGGHRPSPRARDRRAAPGFRIRTQQARRGTRGDGTLPRRVHHSASAGGVWPAGWRDSCGCFGPCSAAGRLRSQEGGSSESGHHPARIWRRRRSLAWITPQRREKSFTSPAPRW